MPKVISQLDPGKFPGKIIGGVLHVEGEPKNKFRKFGNGWALAVCRIEQAVRLGVGAVEVKELGTGRTYRAALADFVGHGRRVHFPPFEPQLVLPGGHWKVSSGHPGLACLAQRGRP